MSLWSRILGAGPAPQERYKDLDDAFIREAFGGVVTATGLRVSADDALKVPGISACIQVLCEDVAKVPCILYRKVNGRRLPAEEHTLYPLLKDGPTPWLSSFAWRRALLHTALARGNAYSRVWRDMGGVIERMTLLRHGATTHRWTEDGEPFFDVSMETGVANGLSFQDVVHMPYRGSTDRSSNGGILGISPIDTHRETIALALAAERFAAMFFANGARPSIALEMDKKLPNDDVARRIRASVERVYGGLDNKWKVAILELGMKLKEISTNPADSQMTETRKEQAVQSCTMFGVAPHKIGILDRATFSNIEHQSIEHVTGPVASLATALQENLEVSCLSENERSDGYYIELNLEGLMRGDIQSRYRAYAIGRQWGWLSADDIRKRENEDDLPNEQGKVYLMPMNMTPADKSLTDDQPEAPPRRQRDNGAALITAPTASEISRFAPH